MRPDTGARTGGALTSEEINRQAKRPRLTANLVLALAEAVEMARRSDVEAYTAWNGNPGRTRRLEAAEAWAREMRAYHARRIIVRAKEKSKRWEE